MNISSIQEKIKLINYNSLTTVSPTGKDNFYQNLSTSLYNLLDLDFICIYTYDQSHKQLLLVAQTNDSFEAFSNKIADPHNKYWNAIIDNQPFMKIVEEDNVFSSANTKETTIAVPIQPSCGPAGIIVLGIDSKQGLAEELLITIKVELERSFTVVNEVIQSKQNEEKYQTLYDITSTFLVLNNKTEIYTEIISSIRRIYPDYTFYLLLAQDHDETLGLPIRAIEFSDDSTKLASSQAFLKAEIQIENRIQKKNTCIYAPLKGHQGVYGVLQIIIPMIIDFPEEEIAFIRKFANTAGKAIESTILYQNSKHLVSDLQLINDLTHQLNSNLDLTEITRLVRDQIIKICKPSEIGFIYKKQEMAHHFEAIGGSTAFFETLEGRMVMRTFVSDILKRKEAIFSGEFTSKDAYFPYHSVMALPMINAGEVNGVVIVLHQDSYAFSFDEFKLLQSIIRHSTLAFVNTILKEQLQKAASTDYLTQLNSRNYLDEKIIQHMKSGEMGTLILFDIDNFKLVNDTYGHYIGDEVIKQVATIMKSNIESRDVAARWGGEELAIYLPNTEINEGVQLARKINTQVESFTEPRVTLSAGVSSWTKASDDSAKNFFVRTDKALYDAKNYGKNCVVKYSIEEQEEDNLHA
ncbi:GGDEF domain-containing protein [Ornithinibacillus sp. BX22]|uniref:GGDEF domain-containing protein n=1 Tax=Ornithinibacillus hominis TaxID=2763055 RepID=A0A923L946_9BACI|nr:sensor domain-containing diguanylate cyclase [Ornithinibacillus hominis]MBC5638636.1 GGDEF domain-containing protein [Ornithinibacillus hominis]